MPLPMFGLLFITALAALFMWYTGRTSPATELLAKRADAKAERFVRELTEEDNKLKAAAARKKAIEAKQARAKAKNEEAKRLAQEDEKRAIDRSIAIVDMPKTVAVPAVSQASQKKSKKKENGKVNGSSNQVEKPVLSESDEEDEEEAFLRRAATMERSRKKGSVRK